MQLLRWVPLFGMGCVSLLDPKTSDSGAPPDKDTGDVVAGWPVRSGGSGSSGDTGVPFEPQVCTTAALESRARPCAVGPDAASVASCAGGGFAALLGGVGYLGVDLALAAAVDGDTVVVCPGTWPGDLTVGAELQLVAADPTPGATVIDGGGVTGGLDITATSTVRGLTVRNGHRPSGGGGVLVSAPSTVLECLTVEDNRASSGGGVNASGAGLIVRTSTFTGNAAGYAGGGLAATAGVTLEDCGFDQNTAGYEGGGVALDGDAVITRSYFTQNLADYSGGAVTWGGWDAGILSVADSDLWCNGSGYEGGGLTIGTWSDDVVTLASSNLLENYADYSGGGLELGSWGAIDLTATGTTFVANRATRSSGGAIDFGGWLQNGALGWFEDCGFHDNRAGWGGGLATSDLGPSYALTAKDTTFLRNDHDAVDLGATSTFSASGCDFGAGVDDNAPQDAETAAGAFTGLLPDVTL